MTKNSKKLEEKQTTLIGLAIGGPLDGKRLNLPISMSEFVTEIDEEQGKVRVLGEGEDRKIRKGFRFEEYTSHCMMMFGHGYPFFIHESMLLDESGVTMEPEFVGRNIFTWLYNGYRN